MAAQPPDTPMAHRRRHQTTVLASCCLSAWVLAACSGAPPLARDESQDGRNPQCDPCAPRAFVGPADTARTRSDARLIERTEHLELACNMGDAHSCGSLSRMLDGRHAGTQQAGIQRDRARAAAFRAAELDMTGCAAGNLDACGRLAYLYLSGTGIGPDLPKAVSLLTAACDGRNTRACHNLGVLYFQGHGVPRAPRYAVLLFTQSCDAGDMRACSALGSAHHQGVGTRADLGRAIELYQRSCSAGDPAGCSGLGVLKIRGQGVAKNVEEGVALLQRACNADGAHGCEHLGELYYRGDGVPQDQDRAVALLQKACHGGDAAGCLLLSSMFAVGHEPVSAESGSAPSAAPGWERRDDSTKARDSDKARREIEILLRRCARGQADACRALGTHGGVSDPGF